MNLYDLINKADLDRGIAEKMINVRFDGDGQRIYNYSDAAMYTPGAWDNPAVRQCRGLIVNDADQIVARPWAKFFNHGQAEAGVLGLDTPVEVTDKLDGSLGIIHLSPTGGLRVATRGSFESDQAIHATVVLNARYSDINSDMLAVITPLVEIVYPENRIVVDYGSRDDLILLGAVNIENGHYYGPTEAVGLFDWAGPVAETFTYVSLRDALAAPPRPGMEGFAVRYLDQSRIVKIKYDDYVRLHRIVTGLSERSIWEYMSEDKPLNDLLGELPDELHVWTREVWHRIAEQVRSIRVSAEEAHDQILCDLGQGFSRKAYAHEAVKRDWLRPYLFQILDGRDPRPAILKTLRPVGQTHARVFSEDVA
ncbi:MAG: 2-5 ligase [Marmoricola sp.]|nr:2-5 ligase [Marmoricola sp.]